MSNHGQSNKKHKTIRVLENKANKGDINALFQLAEYYKQGQFVEKNSELAETYYQRTLEQFQSQRLKIASVKLINFRIFKHVEMDCCNKINPDLTVIIGNNGAGKTTILDSLSISLSWLIRRITTQGGNGDLIEPLDINNDNSSEYASIITKLSIAENVDCEIELSKAVDGSNSSRKNHLQDIGRLAELYKLANSKNDGYNFPVIAYYSVERALDINRKDITMFDDITVRKPWNKFDGYNKALNGTADFKLFFRWFKDLEDSDNAESSQNKHLLIAIDKLKAELNGELIKEMEKKAELEDEINEFLVSFREGKKKEIAILDAKMKENQSLESLAPSKFIKGVTEAIYKFMPGFTKLRIQRSPSLDMLIEKNGMTLSILQLSQGEKSLLALIADIARRMILLNPSLDNSLHGNGVVLIDEIDLHLHPDWQQSVLPNLTNTFPYIQFIVTTHSPPVITTVNHECIRILKKGDIFGAPKGSKGATVSRVLERFFEVKSRPPEDPITQDLNEYKKLVYNDNWQSKRALALRINLNEIFGDEEPDLTELDLYIENRTWEMDIEKISKSNPPNALTLYSNKYPNDSWENFRNINAGNDYKAVKELIFNDQSELCAYCEKSLKNNDTHQKRIEHFQSKSDKNNGGMNWALDWNNVFGVCLGGSDTKDSHSLPTNLSCDSHKEHFETKYKSLRDGDVLNPLEMIATPALFEFDKPTGKLIVNSTACTQYTPKYNNFTNVDDLVENTIKVLNLNCNRLTEDRLKIFHAYSREIKLARKNSDTKIHSRLATKWFGEMWPSYFTTRRLILGRHAERYLNAMKYDGKV